MEIEALSLGPLKAAEIYLDSDKVTEFNSEFITK